MALPSRCPGHQYRVAMTTRVRRLRSLPFVPSFLALAVVLSACGGEGQEAEGGGDDGATSSEATDEGGTEAFAVAELADPAGNDVGTVEFTEVESGVEVTVSVQGFTSGFRGLAVHENPVCEAQSENEDGVVGDFMSAGGHLPGDAQDSGVAEGEQTPEDTAEDAPEGTAENTAENSEDAEAQGEQEETAGQTGQIDPLEEPEQPAPEQPGADEPVAPEQPAPEQPAPEQAPEQEQAPEEETVPEEEAVPEEVEEAEESAGEDEIEHPEHAGDLPNLLITEAGEGSLTVVSDRLTRQAVEAGVSVIITAEPGNFAQIDERYAPQGPDAQTLVDGDAGERSACGVAGESAEDSADGAEED